MFSLDEDASHPAQDLKQAAQQTLQHQYKLLQEQLSQTSQTDFDSLDQLAQKINALKIYFSRYSPRSMMLKTCKSTAKP